MSVIIEVGADGLGHEWWADFWNENGKWEQGGELLSEALAQWGGKFIQDFKTRHVRLEFENEADAVMFLLRWS